MTIVLTTPLSFSRVAHARHLFIWQPTHGVPKSKSRLLAQPGFKAPCRFLIFVLLFSFAR
jgi:hypothetical protein